MKLHNMIDSLAPSKGDPPKSFFGFMKWSLDGSYFMLILSSIFSILTGVMEVSAAIILGLLIDAIVNSSLNQPLSNQVILFSSGIAFFIILRPIVYGLTSYMQTMVITPNVFNLSLSRLHRWTLGQSISFFENDFAGRIAQKEMQTARAVTDVVVEFLQTVVFALASVIGAAFLLSSLDYSLMLCLFVWLFFYLILIKFFMPLIKKRSANRAGSRAALTGQIVDTMTNIKTVKLFAHDKHEDNAALNSMISFKNSSMRYGIIAAWFRFCLNALAGFLPIMMVGGSLFYWTSGNISAGDIAAIGAISLRLSQMTGWVSYVIMAIYSNIGEIEDGIKTLSSPYQLEDNKNAKALKILNGKLDFKGVNFNYNSNIPGVKNISLSILGGEKIGVVGASGAGKSTLVSLLLRLYDPSTGDVLIDKQNLKMVTQESLRRMIGMVTQETALFNRSAKDNIKYGKIDATEKDIIYAAKQAEAHDFIMKLEDNYGRKGYEAHLGEQGVKLSGGQRQRIALSRAILKDSPILILDEATSALDSEVETSIQFALERVMKGKTVMAIAHRLSTLKKMDRIIVMDNGEIIEEGTHNSLLLKKGLYFKYWQHQSGGFIETNYAAE